MFAHEICGASHRWRPADRAHSTYNYPFDLVFRHGYFARCGRLPDPLILWFVEVNYDNQYSSRRIQTIVIGGGQAGLAVGYHLAKRGISFQILDANQRIGDAWRNRWDSLRLFNPARYAGLPGLPFPARGDTFPTKDDVADYLESYAQHFHLPVQTGVKVERAFERGRRLRRQRGRPAVRVGQRGRRHGQLPGSPFAEVRAGARSRHRSIAFSRISQPFPTAGGRRSDRGRGELGGRHRPRGSAYAPDLDVRKRNGARSSSASKAHCGASSWCACCDSSAITS